MKPSAKRSMSIIFAIIFLIGSLFIYKSLIKPDYQEIVGLMAKKQSLKETLDTYTFLNQEFENLLSQYQDQDLEMTQRQLSLTLPNKPDVSYAAAQIVGIAKLFGMKIGSLDIKQLAIKPSDKTAIKGLGTLRMDLQMEGDYENFKSFVKAMETNIMVLNPTNYKIEKQSSGPFLIYKMTVDTHYQSE
ncbi:MAG: hypothetical protein AAB607_00545 [Patescibacteria group bacterium]